MQHKILNDKDDYLLRCRARNDRDIERTLKKYLKKIYIRETIPLDSILYPDHIIDDLRQIGRIASRVMDRLNYIEGGIQIRQLEIRFDKDE